MTEEERKKKRGFIQSGLAGMDAIVRVTSPGGFGAVQGYRTGFREALGNWYDAEQALLKEREMVRTQDKRISQQDGRIRELEKQRGSLMDRIAALEDTVQSQEAEIREAEIEVARARSH